MKQLSKSVAVLLTILLALPMRAGCGDGRDNWQEKMKAEKVAFLTSSLSLTTAEAEKFWPVYNKMEDVRKEGFAKMMKAYKALDEGIKADKPEKTIAALMDSYLTAIRESKDIEKKMVEAFSDIIPLKKIAKLFVAEEEFRRQQIGKWHDGKQGTPPHGQQKGQRPQPPQGGPQGGANGQANK